METYMQWIVSLGASLLDASQLSNDLYGLRISLPKARLLIERGEWGMFKTKENEEVGRLLSQLKDTTGDAEDLLREFDDQMLRHKMETEERNKAGQFVSSSVNLFKSWFSGSKTKVKEAQGKLDKATSEMEDALNIMGVNSEQMQFMPETSSFINFQVMGRDEERDVVIEKLGVMIGRENKRDQVIELLGVPLTRGHTSAGTTRKRAALDIGETSTPISKRLKGKNRSVLSVAIDHCVPVLAIFGIGGMGKTTLAQFVYNDTRVENHFDVRMWVCVSDRFNKKRIIKEIIESIIDQEFSSPLNSDDALEDQLKEQLKEKRFNSSSSLNTLEGLLKKQLTEKKFLLVLDDMWPDANGKWEAFYALLGHGLEGSMVLVTTRCPKVADHVATVEPVPLNGLPVDIFWEFFKKCAFDKHCPDSYPELQDIGHTIADKLCGSPLAAKTLGRLLNDSLTEDHWKCIQNSELWQLPHDENGIMPALQLSYLYLPQELKRCFAVCSMFPKDRSFEKDEIVDFWVAQGFFAPGVSIRIEDTGYRCLDDLRSRFLFQTDPRFPQGSRFVMHDLIHDMAQSVSKDECFLMQESRCQNQIIPHTVRHMSIEVKNEEVLSRLTGLQHLNKLRSLRFGTRLTAEISWFSGLSNILFLSLNGCRLAKLPDALCLLNHVRHLDISHSGIHELPEKFWCLFSLQVFDAYRSSLKTIQEGVTKLVNLRRLALPAKASMDLSRISGLGNLSCLRNLSYFTVGSVNGRRICELKGMNQLSGTLHIKSIGSVQRMEEAAEASLVDKRYLKELVLQWRGFGCALKSRENGVFQALLPPPEIEHLKVEGFGGDIAPSWLGPENLPSLRTIELAWCKSLKQLALHGVTTFRDGTPAPPPTGDDRMQHTVINSGNGNVHLSFTRLTNLRLNWCEGLVNLDQFLCPDYMPSLRSIQIVWCGNLVSLPVHNFVGFACLQDLKIHGCYSVVRPGEMVLPHSLQRLSIDYSGELDKSFRPCFLENLASLTVLYLEDCHYVESILLNSTSANNLKYLLVRRCSQLSSIGGSHALSSIQHVDIDDCPQLTEVQQPWLSRGLGTMEEREILR